MALSKSIAAIGRCLSNRLDARLLEGKCFAAVLGDAPSQYSKSPPLWNAAFRHLRMNAVYLPLDISGSELGKLLAALKDCESFLGANVTVPYKVRVMDFLDGIDPVAARIGAVNTIVRVGDGKLIGHNTDGEGFVQSLLQRQPDREQSFLSSLEKMRVLLLGAGGSARAVAFHLADLLAGGRLLICNRTPGHAQSLVDEIQKTGCEAALVPEGELSKWAPTSGLIINCTIKGQGGIRRLSDHKLTLTEPYSALAPADPPVFAEAEAAQPEFERHWMDAARMDIESNNQASMNLMRSIPPQARLYDLIYHPNETVFLRQGRLTGHPTMNGKSMIINQAVIAFCRWVCAPYVEQRGGSDSREMYKQVLDVMYRAW